jgi:hypothetical protein
MSSVKSERITVLSTPEFKQFISDEASKEGISVSELVRKRCQAEPLSNDEIALRELIVVASKATKRASKSLEKGINDANAVLKELRAGH